ALREVQPEAVYRAPQDREQRAAAADGQPELWRAPRELGVVEEHKRALSEGVDVFVHLAQEVERRLDVFVRAGGETEDEHDEVRHVRACALGDRSADLWYVGTLAAQIEQALRARLNTEGEPYAPSRSRGGEQFFGVASGRSRHRVEREIETACPDGVAERGKSLRAYVLIGEVEVARAIALAIRGELVGEGASVLLAIAAKGEIVGTESTGP